MIGFPIKPRTSRTAPKRRGIRAKAPKVGLIEDHDNTMNPMIIMKNPTITWYNGVEPISAL